MRLTAIALCAISAVTGIASARADHAPSFVVPGRPDVPVPINGYNASWGVAIGDFGLYRPGAVPVTVIPNPYVPPLSRPKPVKYREPAPYFPSLGGKPYVGVGRVEAEPPADRTLPAPAQEFRRDWSAKSPEVPATEYAPMPDMQMYINPDVNNQNANNPNNPQRPNRPNRWRNQ